MRWQKSSGESQPETLKRRHALIVAGLAAIVMVLLVAWLLIDDNESSDTSTAGASAKAEIVSVTSLRKATAAGETPVYWAGATAGSELELSRPSSDRTYVRYLPAGTEAGDPGRFLTVGSYRFPNPTAALRSRGAEPDGVLATTPGNGTVYFSREDPKSVYLAYPGVDVEIEVFAPEFKEALQLVTDGRIVPVE